MILTALSRAGGVSYLAKQADSNPAAFMQLVGKVLPLNHEHKGEMTIRWKSEG